MIIPQIDVFKTRLAIIEMASVIPSGKMFNTILQSIDLMMDDIVDAREKIDSDKDHVKMALKKWDRVFEDFGTREAVYYERITQAEDEDALRQAAYQPLLEGEYNGLENQPDWPDVETPWRLMNSLALIAAESGKGESYFKELEDRWMENFARFWVTCAIVLGQAASKTFLSLQSANLEGPGSSPQDEASLYDQAADKARSMVDSVSDFFSGKTLEETKKTAKHVGIGLGIGLFVGVAVAALVFWRVRR